MTNETLTALQQRSTLKPEPGEFYLALSHGRVTPDQVLEGWGTDGPFIGPLNWCHITYCSTVNLGFKCGYVTGPLFPEDGLGFSEDMLYYDGIYYGDWAVQVSAQGGQ